MIPPNAKLPPSTMITVFTLPKPFVGHIGMIQRNAIQSWTRLHPDIDILMFGSEQGTAEIAAEFGIRHFPDVDVYEYGTPRMSGYFQQAEEAARHSRMCYVNADIVLFPDLLEAVAKVDLAKFVMGRFEDKTMIQNVSVIGLGKLGASMLAGMASRGFNVIGVDITESTIRAVNEGRAPVQETDLEKMIFAHRDKIRATASHEEAVLGSDISFVIVPTPSDSRGAFELQYAKYTFEKLGKALAKKDSYHVIVLTSTVIPGATRHGLLPVLEAASGKKCGKDFGLCYSPEFIALGSVIRDFLNPDFYLVGEFDERSGDALEEVNRKICVKPQDLREGAGRAPHEHRECGDREDRAQQLRHHEDLLRQHPRGSLRADSWR